MNNKKKKTSTIVLIVIFLIVGFFAGQFLNIPALSQYNLLGASANPGSSHHREATGN